MNHRKQTDGFTIIELLIATVFFTVLLMVLTFSIIKLNSIYFKNITVSQTQNTTRSIMDSIAHDIQFGAGSVSVPAPTAYQVSTTNPVGTANSTGYAICTQGGSTRYSIMIGRELKDNPTGNQVSNVVVEDHPTTGCTAGSAGALPLTVGGSFDLTKATNPTELLAPNMRVAYLTVNQPAPGNIYLIQIRIVYGDDDLLSDNFKLDNYNPDGTPKNSNNDEVPGTDGILDHCKNTVGSQFCNVAYLKTWVQKRVQ